MQIVDIGNGRRAPMHMVANQERRKRLDSMFSQPVMQSVAIGNGLKDQNLRTLGKHHGFGFDNNNQLVFSNGHGAFQYVNPGFLADQNRFVTSDGGHVSLGNLKEDPSLASQLLRIKSAANLFTPQNLAESYPNIRATRAMHNAFGVGNGVGGDAPQKAASRAEQSDSKLLTSNAPISRMLRAGIFHPKQTQAAIDFLPNVRAIEYARGHELTDGSSEIDRSDPKQMLFAALSLAGPLGKGIKHGLEGLGLGSKAARPAPYLIHNAKNIDEASPFLMSDAERAAGASFMQDAGQGGVHMFPGSPYFDTLFGNGVYSKTPPWML